MSSSQHTSYSELSVQDINLLNLVDQYRQCSALELSIHAKLSEQSLLKAFTPLVQLGWLVKTGTSPARFRVADKTSKYFTAQKEKQESKVARLLAEQQARLKQLRLARFREYVLEFQRSIDQPNFINVHKIAEQSSLPVSTCYSLLAMLVDGKLLEGIRRQDDTRKCDYRVLPLVLSQTTQERKATRNQASSVASSHQKKQEPIAQQSSSIPIPAAQQSSSTSIPAALQEKAVTDCDDVDSVSTASHDSYDSPKMSLQGAIDECKRVIAQAGAEDSGEFEIQSLPRMYFRKNIIRLALYQ